MTNKEILNLADREKVRFLRLQFTDLGIIKNVEVPRSQFEKALDGRVARMICDVHMHDDAEFSGCPRLALKRVAERAKFMGYSMVAGPEAEFFLFRKDAQGQTLLDTHDVGGYFDPTPVDRGEECRRDIVLVLEAMGFEVEAAHHEVAPGQHEIDFKYSAAVICADNVSTFRFVVKKVALEHGLHATFMPKPIFGINGSGMHVNQSLLKGGENAFYDEDGDCFRLNNAVPTRGVYPASSIVAMLQRTRRLSCRQKPFT